MVQVFISAINLFLFRKCEDPDFWRTVRDPSTGQDVVLSKQDLELIHRLREGHVPDPTHDEYQVRVYGHYFIIDLFLLLCLNYYTCYCLIAMDRVVHSRSPSDSTARVPGTQAFVLTVTLGAAADRAHRARAEDGLDEDQETAGRGEEEEEGQ